ncbi:MAG: hypothetical protein K2H49_02270 [Muribaculaceae bacterium]|nr:hypothetical protein [Muribaculaceae bacterium]
MKKSFIAFSGLISMLLSSCAGETVDYTEPPVPNPIIPEEIPDVVPPSMASAPLDKISGEAIANINDFSLRFYLANSEKNHDNVCVSPLSVGSVLGMMANGDNGLARNEILKTMGFKENEDGLGELNFCYQTLISNLPNMDEDVCCNITNTLWCDPNYYYIRKSFMQTISDSYYATGIGISPRGVDGKEAINAFVSRNTNGLIDNFLIEPLDVTLAFLNTIYFKASWNSAFDEFLTSRNTFIDIENNELKTDFMCSCDYNLYSVTEDGTEAVRLDYGMNRKFSMTFILPSSQINHMALDEVLTPGNLDQLDRNWRGEKILLRIPKFEIEMNLPNTIDILKEIGMEKVCSQDPHAVFHQITESSDFYLKCFIHATKLKVDEKGTEGAAASLGGMVDSAGPGHENNIREINFNRPFIFYIQENTTGAILFIGSVKTLL